ncbi:MAG: flavodoxin FldB [Oceanospirillaceae bacterium]|jgi:flavodoxin II|nr:flavodoxin FldB [Oceanospirillaceae bacterium]
MTIALFFGSTTGNTEDIADQIRDIFGADQLDIYNVADDSVSLMLDYDTLICGIPTWDYGELQADWEDIWEEIDNLNLKNKQFACFGCGDQIGYPEWYQDAVGLLHDKLVAQGASAIGYWPTTGYTFETSKAATADGSQFVGLAVDEDSQHELTDQRVTAWCAQLQQEIN